MCAEYFGAKIRGNTMAIIDGDAGDNVLTGTTGDDVINGFGGNDTITGDSGDDIINGGTGDDMLTGGAGNDTYVFDVGFGVDTVQNYSIFNNGAVDSLSFSDRVFADATFSRVATSGNGSQDLVVSFANGDQVTVLGALNGGNDYQISKILFTGDNSSYTIDVIHALLLDQNSTSGDDIFDGFESLNDVLNGEGGNDTIDGLTGDDTITGGEGDDALRGGSGADTYIYAMGDGSDTIDNYSIFNNGALDRLIFTDYALSSITFSVATALGAGSDDLVIMGDGNDSVNITDGLRFSNDHQISEVIFQNGNITFTADDLRELILEQAATAGNDDITGFGSDDVINGLDGDDTIFAEGGYDIIRGGLGNDMITGGSGDDDYMFTKGDGMDVIDNYNLFNNGAFEQVIFDGWSSTDATYSTVSASGAGSDDLVISFSNGDQVTILDGLRANNDYQLEQVVFNDDAATISIAQIRQIIFANAATPGDDTITGFESNDVIDGLAGNDTIDGGSGDDILIGNTGDDTLYGGAGADRYNLSLGDGVDIIDNYNLFDNGAIDEVNFADHDLSDATFTIVAAGGTAEDDVQITFSNGDSVTIYDLYSGNNDRFMHALNFNLEGDILTTQMVENIFLLGMTQGDDSNILGSAGNDEIAGLDGNDSIRAGDGDDLIAGNAGIDSLQGENGNDILLGGAGDDFLRGGLGDDILNGGSGNDRVDYADMSSGVTVDLNITTLQDTGAGGMDTLISIENLLGSSHGDILNGNSEANFLSGLNGNDLINGGGGNDTLISGGGTNTINGGAGDDLIYAWSGSASIVDGGTGLDTAQIQAPGVFSSSSITIDNMGIVTHITDGLLIATYSNVERYTINLTFLGDTISLGDGDDIVFTSAGDDWVEGGGGADDLNGGQGFDTLSYSRSNAGVIIDLTSNTATGGHATGDIILSFENIIGSAFDDALTGTAGVNIMESGAGDDYIYGDGGADIYDGGAGVDTVDYSAATNRVDVNLLNGTGTGSLAAGDTYTSIENIIGSSIGDTLRGSNAVNVLTGNAGKDTLTGYNGDDALYGGAGRDILIGGNGADILDGGDDVDMVRYTGSTAGVQIDLGAGTAAGGQAAGDTLIDIENLFGSTHGDTLRGDSSNNKIFGHFGDDVLSAGGGIDKLFGGDGADTFVLAAGEGKAFVMDFVDDVDQLDVSAYGFATLADALMNLDQAGTYARFRVGTDVLLIANTDMNDIMDDIVI